MKRVGHNLWAPTEEGVHIFGLFMMQAFVRDEFDDMYSY